MANVLFITKEDIVKITPISGNIDADRITPFIATAQDIHITDILGSDLVDHLKDAIFDGTINDDELNLINKYIKPVLIHYSLSDFLLFNQYQIKNGGIFVQDAENATSADRADVVFLSDKERERGDWYRRRLVDYIGRNTDLFPEYTGSQQDGGVYPSGSTTGKTGFLL